MSPDAKIETEYTTTAPVSQKRIEANRLNAKKSTGPRSPAGKPRSRLNAVTHGLTAKITVLPGEDPAEFAAHRDAVISGYAPQTQVEHDLLARIADASWALGRCQRAETAHLLDQFHQAPIDQVHQERDEVLALGERLLWDPRGPWQFYPLNRGIDPHKEPRISCSSEPGDPNTPARLLLRLERTVAGCDWLLERWAELRERLETGDVWVGSDRFKAAPKPAPMTVPLTSLSMHSWTSAMTS
jgi:hypothetical protein